VIWSPVPSHHAIFIIFYFLCIHGLTTISTIPASLSAIFLLTCYPRRGTVDGNSNSNAPQGEAASTLRESRTRLLH